jgi:hypothetical protein
MGNVTPRTHQVEHNAPTRLAAILPMRLAGKPLLCLSVQAQHSPLSLFVLSASTKEEVNRAPFLFVTIFFQHVFFPLMPSRFGFRLVRTHSELLSNRLPRIDGLHGLVEHLQTAPDLLEKSAQRRWLL